MTRSFSMESKYGVPAPSATVWISDFEDTEKCTAWPTAAGMGGGEEGDPGAGPAAWPAAEGVGGGVNLASCLACLIAAAYSAFRAAASARVEGTARPLGSTFTLPCIPGC